MRAHDGVSGEGREDFRSPLQEEREEPKKGMKKKNKRRKKEMREHRIFLKVQGRQEGKMEQRKRASEFHLLLVEPTQVPKKRQRTVLGR